MSVLQILQDEMKNAMRAKDVKRLSALRMLISAIRYAQIDKPDLDDEGMTSVLKKEAKKRKESVEAYKLAGRDESAKSEQYELELIESYLPKQMSEEELRGKVKEVIESSSFANFGMAMNAVMKVVGKEADGSLVSRIVRELFKA